MQMITANRLGDGVPVFFTASGGWAESLSEGAIAASKGEAEAMMRQAEAAAAACVVIAPYLIDVRATDEGYEALRIRERIRADGPTIRYVADGAA